MLWIAITVAAAFLQNARSALQKNLKKSLSSGGATAARFIFAFPCAALILIVHSRLVSEIPLPGTVSLSWMLFGGFAQLLATWLLMQLFSYRNFAVSTALSKTEVIQTAILGVILLADFPTHFGWAMLAISSLGTVLIALPKQKADDRFKLDRTTLLGITAGGLFGLSAVCYRGASTSLDFGSTFTRALVTLTIVTALQTIMILIWLRVKEAGEISRLFRAWRPAAAVGLTGMLASLCWFYVFNLQNAAVVRAVGQVEIVFTLIVSIFFFKERLSKRELLGITAIIGATIGIVLTA